MVLLSFLYHLSKPLYHSWIIVGEEGTGFRVKRCYGSHVFLGKREIKYIQIFLHSFDVGGFRNDDHASLQMPAEDDLCRTLIIFCANFIQYRILEHIASSFTEGSPGFDLYIVLIHPFFCFDLLVKRVRLHLIDHWANAGKGADIHQTVWMEIRDTDGTNFSALQASLWVKNAVFFSNYAASG